MESTRQSVPWVIPLWPEVVPGSESWDWQEEESQLPSGDRVIRNVSHPTLTVYRPQVPNGTAVIICPGGAFHFLSIDFEGTDVALWLTKKGITAFVLRYRLVRTDNDFLETVFTRLRGKGKLADVVEPLYPLLKADIGRSLQLVHYQAPDWGVNPQRIGVLGFSAGAVVTILAALTNSDLKPAFLAPIYCGPLPSFELPPDAPPLFALCANDDRMAVENTRILADKYQACGQLFEMHIYGQGGHGFGMKIRGLPVDHWIERFYDWLTVLYPLPLE